MGAPEGNADVNQQLLLAADVAVGVKLRGEVSGSPGRFRDSRRSRMGTWYGPSVPRGNEDPDMT